MAPDSRAERTKKEIISEDTYNQMFQLLQKLPSSCRHVVVLLTVPIVFPALSGQEKVWRLLDNAKVGHIMSKTGQSLTAMQAYMYTRPGIRAGTEDHR